MPRAKYIYVGDGQYVEATARCNECEHPRNRLRFDSRDALPMRCYCVACGMGNISPWHGLTDNEIEQRQQRAQEFMEEL